MLKFLQRILLFVEYSYHIMAAEIFLNLTIYFSQILLLRLEIFLGVFITLLMISMETGRISTAASVIHTLMESIMINTPISVVTDVISCVMLWLMLICRVSTSVCHPGKDLTVCSTLEIIHWQTVDLL